MYIKRDGEGRVVAVSVKPEGDICEAMATDTEELQHFLQGHASALHQSLIQSDLQMARVLEDTINVLMDKGILRFTDLPEAAQQKLLHRREIRGRFNAIDLLDDDDDIGL